MQGLVAFGEFVLDRDRGCLRRKEEVIPLRPKSFAMLEYLVDHCGHLVSRQDLMTAIWPGVVVTDDSVAQCLIELRRALGDESHTMIKTVPRRGLIFDIPVEPFSPSIAPDAARGRSWLSQHSLKLVIVATGVIAMTVWWASNGVQPERMRSVIEDNAIAVLPFVDMSPAGDQEHFADGISEEILNQLARSPGLTVIARTSSFAFKGKNEDVRSIAETLDVSYVLEGSVQTDKDAFRVIAQLISAKDGRHLWSNTYDGEFDDIFTVQRNIAKAVAIELKVSLGEPTNETSVDPDAYALYLEGRFFYFRRGDADRKRAQDRFEQSLSISPEFAPAWAGLAAAISTRLFDHNATQPEPAERKELLTMQENAVEHALRFGPENVEVQHRAAQYYFYNGQKERAKEHLEAARSIDPDHWLVLSAAANDFRKQGRINESITISRQMIRRDPLNFIVRSNFVNQLLWAQSLDQAEVELGKLTELIPAGTTQSTTLVRIAARLQLLQGQYHSAADTAAALPPDLERAQLLSLAYQGLERQQEFESMLERVISDSDNPWAALYTAEIYAVGGKADLAAEWLRKIDFRTDCKDEYLAQSVYYSPFLAKLGTTPEWKSFQSEVLGVMGDCRAVH